MQFSTVSALLLSLLITSASAKNETFKIVVSSKGDDLAFHPPTLRAPVGAIIEFDFANPAHSVVRSEFDFPCAEPKNKTVDHFNSGVQGQHGEVFKIHIRHDDPIYFYCSFNDHCRKGMVGIINPPANESRGFAPFKKRALAVNVTNIDHPTDVTPSYNGTDTSIRTTSTATTTATDSSGSSTMTTSTTVVTDSSGASATTSVSSTSSTARPSSGAGRMSGESQFGLGLGLVGLIAAFV